MTKVLFFVFVSTAYAQGMFYVSEQDVHDACCAFEERARGRYEASLKVVLAKQMFIGGYSAPLSCFAQDIAKKIAERKKLLIEKVAVAKKNLTEYRKDVRGEKKSQEEYDAETCEEEKNQFDKNIALMSDFAKVWCKGDSQNSETSQEGESGVLDMKKVISLAMMLREMGDQVLEESLRKRNAIDHALCHQDY